MPDLRELTRSADRIAAPDLWSEVERRAGREPPRRTLSRALVAAAAVAIAVAGLTVAVREFVGDRPAGRRPASSPWGAIPIEPRVTAQIPVGPFPGEMAVGEGAVWVTVNSPEAPESWYVARIEPATNEVTDRIPVFEVVDVAVGEGAVWALGAQRGEGGAVFRIDADTGEVGDVIPLDCGRGCFASQIAVGSGAVWVTASGNYPDFGYVIRLDPETATVTSRVRVGGDPRDLVVTDTDVWVYSLTHFGGGGVEGGTLYRIDTTTGELAATLLEGRIPPLSGGSGPPVLAFGHGYLWTSVELSTDEQSIAERLAVVRIDPRTNDIAGDPIPMPPPELFLPFSTNLGAVWFRGGDDRNRPVDIYRIDPRTLQIEEVIDTPSLLVIDGAVDPSTATMWVSNYERTVTRIDLR